MCEEPWKKWHFKIASPSGDYSMFIWMRCGLVRTRPHVATAEINKREACCFGTAAKMVLDVMPGVVSVEASPFG